jgi:hypothetical protein
MIVKAFREYYKLCEDYHAAGKAMTEEQKVEGWQRTADFQEMLKNGAPNSRRWAWSEQWPHCKWESTYRVYCTTNWCI